MNDETNNKRIIMDKKDYKMTKIKKNSFLFEYDIENKNVLLEKIITLDFITITRLEDSLERPALSFTTVAARKHHSFLKRFTWTKTVQCLSTHRLCLVLTLQTIATLQLLQTRPRLRVLMLLHLP